jgi:hypothetical protein
MGWGGNVEARNNGIFGYQTGMERNISDVTDGTSNTILLGEHRLGDNDNSFYRPGDVVRGITFTAAPNNQNSYWPITGNLYDAAAIDAFGVQCQAGIANHHSHGGRNWVCPQPSQTIFNTVAPPNWKYPTCQVCPGCSWFDSPGAFPARSFHPGGAMHALADGSVTFITNTIFAQTYCHLGNRSDGQSVTVP